MNSLLREQLVVKAKLAKSRLHFVLDFVCIGTCIIMARTVTMFHLDDCGSSARMPQFGSCKYSGIIDFDSSFLCLACLGWLGVCGWHALLDSPDETAEEKRHMLSVMPPVIVLLFLLGLAAFRVFPCISAVYGLKYPLTLLGYALTGAWQYGPKPLWRFAVSLCVAQVSALVILRKSRTLAGRMMSVVLGCLSLLVALILMTWVQVYRTTCHQIRPGYGVMLAGAIVGLLVGTLVASKWRVHPQ